MMSMRIRVPMRCPVCLTPMVKSDRREELHVDPSGHGLYVCPNADCEGVDREGIIYRRVTKGVDDRRLVVLTAAQETNSQQLQQFRVQNERLNELTVWLRNYYPQHMHGQFKDSIDIAIYVMSKGKDDRRMVKGDGGDGQQ